MRTLHLVLILLGLTAFVSCSKNSGEEIGKGEFTKPYIRTYLDAKSIAGKYSNGVLEMYFTTGTDGRVSINSSGFEYFSQYYADTCYNRTTNAPRTNGALLNELVSWEITSDLDFDEAHPAGTPLNDIVQFYGTSAMPFIKSGYIEFDWLNNLPDEYKAINYYYSVDGYYPVHGVMSELKADEMKLLSDRFFLKFTKTPPEGDHTLNITFSSATKEMTGKVSMLFRL